MATNHQVCGGSVQPLVFLGGGCSTLHDATCFCVGFTFLPQEVGVQNSVTVSFFFFFFFELAFANGEGVKP